MRAFTTGVMDLGRVKDSLRLREGFAQVIGAKGLEEVILQPAGDEVAVETDIVDLTGRDDYGSRLTYFGQAIDVVDRIARLRHVD